MGWELVASDPAAGRIEATDTTFWFGFKDDIVVRVTPDPAGSRIDVRSVSRVGVGDIGANAARIRKVLEGPQRSLNGPSLREDLTAPTVENARGSRQRIANQLKFATDPPGPTLSITTLMTCVPAASAIPVLVIVFHVCHPPVFGTVSVPVLFTPSTSTWKVPPMPLDARRTSSA